MSSELYLLPCIVMHSLIVFWFYVFVFCKEHVLLVNLGKGTFQGLKKQKGFTSEAGIALATVSVFEDNRNSLAAGTCHQQVHVCKAGSPDGEEDAGSRRGSTARAEAPALHTAPPGQEPTELASPHGALLWPRE